MLFSANLATVDGCSRDLANLPEEEALPDLLSNHLQLLGLH